jgi:molybdopterin-guanine dinucleotide biosynthesis protein A
MKILKKEMLVLIMIGGQSKRMGGGIKSLIQFNNKNLLDRILERIKPQIKNIIINCNNEEERFLKYNIPVIKDLKKGYLGPLAGIHSAMNWIKKNEPQVEWLITLPGDTPFIPCNLISSFRNNISKKSKIILTKSNNKIHPVIGAWNISLIDSLNFHLDKGVRKVMSWAKLHQIDYINYPIKLYDPFFNINTKEDIKIAEEIEKNFIEIIE